MSDTSTNKFIGYGTNAERLAFMPDPATIAAAPNQAYLWYESDTDKVFAYTTAWHQIASSSSGSAISALTGDVTATGPGSVAATIANDAVTLAKLANAAANDKVLGSGNSGSGSNYAEITLGSGLTMTGTTLSSTGSGGTVTHTGGALTSGKVVEGAGAADVAVSTLTATVVKASSGTLSAATGGTDYTDLAFKTIAVSGQSDVVADTPADTLTLAAGSNITLTTNAGTDTVTIAASGSGSGTITTGTYASLPGTCAVGEMYVLTDSVYPFAVCRSANVWTFFLNGKIATPPGLLSGWTTVNTGANWTAADSGGSLAVQISRNASNNWRALTKNQPSTPYTVTYFFKAQQQTSNTMLTGVYFYDGTKLMGLEFLSQNSVVSTIRVEKITNVTTDSGTAASQTSWWGASPFSNGVYARLGNDGSTLTFSWSLDGITFYSLFSEAIGTFITPTQYGFGGLNASTAGFLATISMQSIVLA